MNVPFASGSTHFDADEEENDWGAKERAMLQISHTEILAPQRSATSDASDVLILGK